MQPAHDQQHVDCQWCGTKTALMLREYSLSLAVVAQSGTMLSTARCLYGQQAKSLHSCCNQRDFSFCEGCWRLRIAVGLLPLSMHWHGCGENTGLVRGDRVYSFDREAVPIVFQCGMPLNTLCFYPLLVFCPGVELVGLTCSRSACDPSGYCP